MTPAATVAANIGVTVHIYNSAGELVYTAPEMLMFNHAITGISTVDGAFVPGPGAAAVFQLNGANGVFTWSGTNSNGQMTASGVYTVEFTESNGPNPVTYSVDATVLALQTQSNVSIFNSAGELVDYFPVTGSAAFLSVGQNGQDSFIPGQGKGILITWGPGAGDSMYWNGTNANGIQVASGTYLVEVTTQSAGDPVVTRKGVIVVMDPNADLLAGAAIGPNPLAVRGEPLTVFAPALAAGDFLEVEIYDLAGQLVAQSYGEGPKLQLSLPDSAAGGVYLVVLRARNAQTGVTQRRVLKLAVIR
ncbi:MAG TPA: T9SS type A sorting domain-containing protein [bacterium]|nr:T9SS type A sorting domain-containing protein [bacterium]